jgi:DNA-binding IscR family transcriptional regulator
MNQESTSKSKISETMSIPYSDLQDTLESLKQAGWISDQQGNEDEYALKTSPEEVTLWDIMALKGETPRFTSCTADGCVGDNYSGGNSPAELWYVQDVQARIEAGFRDVFQDVTLKDLMDHL